MAKCAGCNKILNKKSPILECSRCQKVVHAVTQCTGLSAKQLNALKAAENLEWACSDCNLNSSRRKSYTVLQDDDDEEEEHIQIPEASINIKKLVEDIKREVCNTISRELQSLNNAVQYCSEKIDEFTEALSEISTKTKEVEKKQKNLENRNIYLETKLEALEQRFTEIEQHHLADSVEIVGIPEISDFKLSELIQNIADRFQAPKHDVISIKRLPSRRPGARPVIVRLREGATRQRFLTAAREKVFTAGDIMPGLTGPPAAEKIFIREPLTPYYKHLLWQAKQELKDIYKYIWFKDSKVLARKNENSKIFRLRTVKDIQPLLSKND